LLARCVLIDGRAGSGKTELARSIAEAWPDVQVVHLDDVYPGWDGLAAGSADVPDILIRHRWRAWNWDTAALGEWQPLDPERPLVIEGVGAISQASRSLADTAVWMDLDTRTRKERALGRDGDAFAPHWDRWAAQEVAFIDHEHPDTLADLVLDGRSAADAFAIARVALGI